MATTGIPDFNGIERQIENPLAPGRGAAAASKPVVLSNEDKAALDAVATQTTAAAILAKLSADPATQTTLAAVLAKIIAAPATEAKQDTTNTALGAVGDAAVTNPASSASAIAVLKGLLTLIASNSDQLPVALDSDGRLKIGTQAFGPSSASFTSGTTAYAAQDAVGASGAAAALTFASVGPAGGRIRITDVSLRVDSSAIISGQSSYVLHLYDVNPPSAYNDSAAWDLPSGDRAGYLGSISLGTVVDLGSTLYIEQIGVNKQIKLASASSTVYGYLVTVGAYTPTAQVYTVTLNSIALT